MELLIVKLKQSATKVFFIAVFLVAAYLSQRVISNSILNQQNKIDFSEVNHVKYGLFNVNSWKEKLAVIVKDEIGALSLSNTNEKVLKKHIEVQLDGLIDNVENKLRDSNKGTAKGWLKQAFINALVDVKDIKEGIPQFADAIITEMNRPQTKKQLKEMVIAKVDKYFRSTFQRQDLARLNQILQRTGTADIESAKVKLDQDIRAKQKVIHLQAGLLIAIALMLFAAAAASKKTLTPPLYFLLLAILFLLLLVGVTTPMIDMEAKISEMSFVLMDHPVTFLNQVLYFQTKSILDVFWIMFTNKDLLMKAVGLLMISFSIVFPIVKMLSSVAYYFNYRKARARRWIQFFVLKSGKWSMADVLVVSMFMAYVGFNGIITSQFGNMSSVDQDLVLIATNGTSLQPGFYVFLAYTLLALVLSGFLERKPKPIRLNR